MCDDKAVQRLLVNFTVTSKAIPGLKYLGVFLKLMVYGDVTIGIFSNSASTISLPVELKQRLFCLHKKVNISVSEMFLCFLFFFLGAFFSPLSASTLTWTNMELPRRSKTLGKTCVRCSLLSVTSPWPWVIYSDMKWNEKWKKNKKSVSRRSWLQFICCTFQESKQKWGEFSYRHFLKGAW